MIEVTVDEFKNNLEQYIQKVHTGDVVNVLENGKAKARLIAMRIPDFSASSTDKDKREYSEDIIDTTKAEFIKNLNSYLQEAENGKAVVIIEKEIEIARLTAIDSFDLVRSLIGALETDYTDEEIKEIIREEMIKKYESID